MCLRYSVGSSFNKHSHLKISNDHLGDMIIFPPIHLLPIQFKGGNLIIYHEDKIEIIEVDSLTEWKVVRLNLNIPHEVSEVTEGIRYSFKFDIYE